MTRIGRYTWPNSWRSHAAAQFQQAVFAGHSGVTTIRSAGGVYLDEVATPAGPVKVAWSDTRTPHNIRCAPGTRVFDQSGNLLHTIHGSSYPAQVSPSPIYLLPPL